MWIYDSVSEELVNLNEHIHNINIKDFVYDSGTEYRIMFMNIIKCNSFSILYKNKTERDNYYKHIIVSLKPTMVDSTNPPITL